MILRRPSYAIAAAGLVGCLAITVLIATSDYGSDKGELHELAPVIAAVFIGIGLWVHDNRPERGIGTLMVCVGFSWIVATLIVAEQPGLFMIGWTLYVLPYVIMCHLLLSFPTGKLRNAVDRTLALGGYLVATVLQLALAFFYVPEDGRENPLLITANGRAYDVLVAAQAAISVAALVAIAYILFERRRQGTTVEQDAMAPVLAAGIVMCIALMFSLVGNLTDDDNISDLAPALGRVAILCVPFAFLAGLFRTRYAELAQDNTRLAARLVVAGDAERQRLERDLHDGAQQRLVALALTLRLARGKVDVDGEAAELLDEAVAELGHATDELRELARGIHPAVLTDRGLDPALRALASRSPVPVEITGVPRERLPPTVESAAYFLVAEALTNVARYARASEATVRLQRVNGTVAIEVSDDGVGGADLSSGSGLRGMLDRVAALDGTLIVQSPPGKGTTVRAELPCGS